MAKKKSPKELIEALGNSLRYLALDIRNGIFYAVLTSDGHFLIHQVEQTDITSAILDNYAPEIQLTTLKIANDLVVIGHTSPMHEGDKPTATFKSKVFYGKVFYCYTEVSAGLTPLMPCPLASLLAGIEKLRYPSTINKNICLSIVAG
jgi:hypothetical protein